MFGPPLIPAAALHLAEAAPPVIAGIVYLALYGKRVGTLSRERRPVSGWRVGSFVFGVALVVAGWIVLSFLTEPSAVGRMRTALMAIGVGSIAVGGAGAVAGVWMLIARRT